MQNRNVLKCGVLVILAQGEKHGSLRYQHFCENMLSLSPVISHGYTLCGYLRIEKRKPPEYINLDEKPV